MSAGHIRRRGEHSWELKFDLGTDPLTGKRLTRYHSVKGTKREAQAELNRLLASAGEGSYIDPTKTTLSDFLDRWERDWAEINVSPKTIERYRELLRLHVRPHLGAVRIQKLAAVNLAGLYTKLLRERGLSARTVGHVHRVLHKALRIATEWTVITRNPADIAKPPKVEPTDVETLSEQQVGQVLTKLRGEPIFRFILLALATGMRRGELLALRWRDVDLDAASLRVEQSLEQTKGGLRFKGPKTKHGKRAIALPASVVSELRGHRKEQQEHRLRLGLGRAPDDALVFPNWDGTARSPNAATKEWGAAVARLQLPRVSLHALRHTHASQLIASKMDVLTISRRLGHGSPTITLSVYAHKFGDTDKAAADIIEAAFAWGKTE
jgi:integrase